MNYLRGAVVNAISAPYQFYKDVNPSTLTGAIDVIVIQRPAADGDGTELACSPFHVRFGKWQVLRPAEKKVNVSVNGNPIPYNMKIGDAGEAFFVFETEDDVPEELITSPILQATTPESDAAAHAAGAHASGKDVRFGADDEQQGKDDVVGEKTDEARADEEEEIFKKHEEPSDETVGEPEYLDLDGRPQTQPPRDVAGYYNHITPKQSNHVPAFVRRSSSRTTLNGTSYLAEPERRRSNSVAGDRTPEMLAQDAVVDRALQALNSDGHYPEVEYHKDVALDMEGYHSGRHDKERSDRTVRSSNIDDFKLPPSQLPLSTKTSPTTPADVQTDHSQESSQSRAFLMPQGIHRATSEPPPDVEPGLEASLTTALNFGHSTSDLIPQRNTHGTTTRLQIIQQHQQEYMWEWGNFPQPSPMKTTFSKSGRIESSGLHASGSSSSDVRWTRTRTVKVRNGRLGGMRLPVLQDSDEERENGEDDEPRGRGLVEKEHGRSHSVPHHTHAASSSSLHKSKKHKDRKRWKEYEDFEEGDEDDAMRESRLFKDEGGSLSASKGDPTKFILSIEGQKVGFQLSLAGLENLNPSSFQEHIIDFERFLDDPSLIKSPNLVIRWLGVEQYITRDDSEQFIDALSHWRDLALQKRASGQSLRPVSPSTDESVPASPSLSESPPPSQQANLTHMRAQSEPPEEAFRDEISDQNPPAEGQVSTSSSWVPWWGRSKKREAAPPDAPVSVPLEDNKAIPVTPPEQPSAASTLDTITQAAEDIPVNEVKPTPESTPSGQERAAPAKTTKYAKTLRLTSDQLKALNLQPGPNTITFSLSATGAVAATARIFVWEHTDLVVVSDIDGTITKSDGLGHVFAMIGRDWTHLGVAKLYTDITRNGYKIMYLTSRAIGQADATRGYLKGIKQNNYQLPEGPVIMSPDRLMTSLHREVVLRKPEVFKMACLRDIQRLFGENHKYQFYAGFGNRITDALSYRTVNIPSARIFTIDSAGEVKMELLELAGYKSSYIHMTDLVDQMFPPIHKKWTPEYTDFNYWRAPVQEYALPDFSPPSPALSARSDTSALTRLRNFNFVGSRQSTIAAPAGGKRQDGDGEGDAEDGYRSTHLRQMSSFERLSSTLGFMTAANSSMRSASPESQASDYDSDDEATLSDGAVGRMRRKRERRRSMTSMPGSLMDEEEEMHFSDDEGDDEYGDEEHDGEGEEGVEEEEAFDEDLLAAGEMQNVPFL